jgi:RNA polymerase sigma-70 factor (ECF subfamily)
VVRALPHAYPDEPSLVRALVARQPAAAAAAWDRFAPLVRGLLWQSLGAFSDVDDLAQDVFLHFFRRIPDLRDPNAVSSFVVGITIRVARGELRRRRLRRWLRLSDDGALPDVPVAGADVDAREALSRLYAILDRVDDDARLAFVLRHVQGLELTEVAQALGCSLATAKRRISKANQRIAVHARGDRALEPFLDALGSVSASGGDPADEQSGAHRAEGRGRANRVPGDEAATSDGDLAHLDPADGDLAGAVLADGDLVDGDLSDGDLAGEAIADEPSHDRPPVSEQRRSRTSRGFE